MEERGGGAAEEGSGKPGPETEVKNGFRVMGLHEELVDNFDNMGLREDLLVEAWLLYKRRVGLRGARTADAMEGTALAADKWAPCVDVDTGASLWEGAEACTYSRRVAALGMTHWRDVADPATGTWLEWKQVAERYGSRRASDETAFNALRAELAAKPRAAQWLAHPPAVSGKLFS